EDCRLPNVGTDYTRIGGPKRYIWNPEEKQVLYILSKHYSNQANDLWKVYNAYFYIRYRQSKKPRRSAWETMRLWNLNPTRYRVWWNAATTARVKQRLDDIAHSVDVRLLSAPQGTLKKLVTTPRKRASPAPSTSSSGNGSWQSDQSDPIEKPRTPKKQHYKLAGGLLTPPSSGKQNASQEYRPIPPIAFRAFSSISQGLNGAEGFVAGTFMHDSPLVAQYPVDEQNYLHDLERHLGRDHQGHTPFVSVSAKLLRVFHHALRRTRSIQGEPTEWKLAVIQLSAVPSLVRAVWDLEAGEHAPKSKGEWVVYGAIQSSQVLAVLPIDKVLRCMSATTAPFFVGKILAAKNTGAARRAVASSTRRKLDGNDGIAFGRLMLLLGIPERHLRRVCWSLLADWWYPEHKADAWMSNDDFVQGLSEGYKQLSPDFADLDRLPNGLIEGEASHQRSPATQLGFENFLADVENTAFGGRPNEDAEVKRESPDCSLLNTIPACFRI
ncbi:MAG: hypothetical protein LQ341_006528, partial [Variospora aurantia]